MFIVHFEVFDKIQICNILQRKEKMDVPGKLMTNVPSYSPIGPNWFELFQIILSQIKKHFEPVSKIKILFRKVFFGPKLFWVSIPLFQL